MQSIFRRALLLPVILIFLFAHQNTICETQAKEPRFKTLVPGLTIKRLPVKLKNINSVEYGPDGRLYAAGYDGTIHVLTDTDGDGLEDKTEIYWSKSGDLLTPVGILPTKQGVYISARGKVALLKDTDGDGIADKSEAIVTGWEKETHNSNNRNDAAGVAIDALGNLYFSLGCMSYNKAWLLDKKGNSQYDPKSERGTILKVSPDRKKREIVATGLRFIVGMEFNKHHDLFATDQEGDTWFPGGNPRDELLHIIPGRHYGFPFRHPKYLPNSIDEPYVVGFSPQHQSACGFRFNETRINRKQFGPDFWEGDAIVTGFSRGKLWRAPLAKTKAGYVGRQVQFLAFESLPTDVAISPQGQLLMTSHSGHPDWGAGPAANGYLYKIFYNSSAPQPVLSWSASPLEIKIAFDKPINSNLLKKPEIEMGEFVWEGDQHEWIFPGYEVVKAAKKSLRHPLKVQSTKLSSDGRTLTLLTAPQSWKARYAIKLPGVAKLHTDKNEKGSTIELSHDMGGVFAKWAPKNNSQSSWNGWLPHVDSNVFRTLTRGSVEHEQLLKRLNKPGNLSLNTQLHLPGKKVTLYFESSNPFLVRSGKNESKSKRSGNKHVAQLTLSASKQFTQHAKKTRGDREQILPTDLVPLQIELETGSPGEWKFTVSFQADFDTYHRPLKLEHFIVPWAPTHRPQNSVDDDPTSTKLVGDPAEGRKIFFGKEANCSVCHAFAGKGGKVAADLTVSMHRSPEAILRDIIKPNAAINPDYVSYTIATAQGKILTGLLQSADEKQVALVDVKGNSHPIERNDIEEIRPSSVSLMPAGFDKLGKKKLQDLVAFLSSGDPAAKQKGHATGVIKREVWFTPPQGGIVGLTKHSDYPNKPAVSGLLTRFEVPINWKEQYVTRVSGFIHPPETGDYIFWLAADDHAELWLSSSDQPNKKKRILKLDRWVRSRDWDAYPEQKSKPIHLQAGKRYYIEALHAEATVDDNLAVGWELPDGEKERPIPGTRLSPAK